MKEIRSVAFGKFVEEKKFSLEFAPYSERKVLREKLELYFNTQWSEKDELNVLIESTRFVLFEDGYSLVLKKETEHSNSWLMSWLLVLLFFVYNIELFNKNYFIASFIFIVLFLLIYLPIRRKQKKIWHIGVGVITALTKSYVRE